MGPSKSHLTTLFFVRQEYSSMAMKNLTVCKSVKCFKDNGKSVQDNMYMVYPITIETNENNEYVFNAMIEHKWKNMQMTAGELDLLKLSVHDILEHAENVCQNHVESVETRRKAMTYYVLNV